MDDDDDSQPPAGIPFSQNAPASSSSQAAPKRRKEADRGPDAKRRKSESQQRKRIHLNRRVLANDSIRQWAESEMQQGLVDPPDAIRECLMTIVEYTREAISCGIAGTSDITVNAYTLTAQGDKKHDIANLPSHLAVRLAYVIWINNVNSNDGEEMLVEPYKTYIRALTTYMVGATKEVTDTFAWDPVTTEHAPNAERYTGRFREQLKHADADALLGIPPILTYRVQNDISYIRQRKRAARKAWNDAVTSEAKEVAHAVAKGVGLTYSGHPVVVTDLNRTGVSPELSDEEILRKVHRAVIEWALHRPTPAATQPSPTMQATAEAIARLSFAAVATAPAAAAAASSSRPAASRGDRPHASSAAEADIQAAAAVADDGSEWRAMAADLDRNDMAQFARRIASKVFQMHLELRRLQYNVRRLESTTRPSEV